ncbi:unnamed protein product [Leuciscus chuanchicus]
MGNENTNGTLLLEICAQHDLAITNSYQQANLYKTTWQHPQSKHWHVLDYIIPRQEHLREVHTTRAMRGTSCWSDHRLLRSTLSDRLSTLDNQAVINVEETWSKIRDIPYNTAAEVLGFTTSKHKDWFDGLKHKPC